MDADGNNSAFWGKSFVAELKRLNDPTEKRPGSSDSKAELDKDVFL